MWSNFLVPITTRAGTSLTAEKVMAVYGRGLTFHSCCWVVLHTLPARRDGNRDEHRLHRSQKSDRESAVDYRWFNLLAILKLCAAGGCRPTVRRQRSKSWVQSITCKQLRVAFWLYTSRLLRQCLYAALYTPRSILLSPTTCQTSSLNIITNWLNLTWQRHISQTN